MARQVKLAYFLWRLDQFYLIVFSLQSVLHPDGMVSEAQSSCPTRLPEIEKIWTKPCTERFNYCAPPGGSDPLPGVCPGKLVFNPNVRRCDGKDPCSEWQDEEASRAEGEAEGGAPKKPVPQDNFCRKHPCGLYPSYDDCRSYFLCSGGLKINKRCPGKNIFDFEHKDCRLDGKCIVDKYPFPNFVTPSDVVEEVDPVRRVVCPFHGFAVSPNAILLKGNQTGLVLPSPKITDKGGWEPWGLCHPGSYFTGLSLWRRSTDSSDGLMDHAGVISVGFKCEDPFHLKSKDEYHVVGQYAKGVPDTSWRDYLHCENGAAVGYQLSQHEEQGVGNDNLGTDNIRMLCSCGADKVKAKPYHKNIPAYVKVGGQRGTWTDAMYCQPKQAVCGLRTQMQNWNKESVINLKELDMTGLNQMKVKCCDVEDPAGGKPFQTFKYFQTCDNTNSSRSRLCPFNITIGTSYNRDAVDTAIAFYESIGYTFAESVGKLRAYLKAGGIVCEPNDDDDEDSDQGANNGTDETCNTFSWSDADEERLFQLPKREYGQLLVKPFAKISLHQVVISSQNSLLSIYSNHFIQERQTAGGAKFAEKCPGSTSFIHNLGDCHSEDCAQKSSSADVAQIVPKDVAKKIDIHHIFSSFHGYPASSGTASKNQPGTVISLPDTATSEGDWKPWKSCPDGSYITGVTVLKQATRGKQNIFLSLGFTCQNPLKEGDASTSITTTDEDKIGADVPASDSMSCDKGVAVGLQFNQLTEQGPGKDETMTENVRLICSAGAQKFKTHHKSDDTTWLPAANCGDKQALCAVRSNQVTFAAEEDKVDVGMNQLKLTCCNVPPPDKCSPVQQRRFIQTCDNKDSKNRKYCQFDAPLGVLLNSDGKNEDHVSFHQSVGYQPDQLNEALKKIIRQPDTSIKCQQENGQKVDCDKCWKASAGKELYDGVRERKGEIEVKGEVQAKLHQTIISCGLFTLFTNQIIIGRQGTTGPLPDEYAIF